MPNSTIRLQIAALPYRVINGGLEILLITSRDTGRWILPKGWLERKTKPRKMAAIEAFEEAGVRGVVEKHAIGEYRYEKRLDKGGTALCRVSVFPLRVREELDDWPERAERERRWVRPAQAAMMISESGLVDLLLRLGLPEV